MGFELMLSRSRTHVGCEAGVYTVAFTKRLCPSIDSQSFGVMLPAR
jgi:hypothetical protein